MTKEEEREARAMSLIGATVTAVTYSDVNGHRFLTIVLSNGAEMEMSYTPRAYGTGESLRGDVHLKGVSGNYGPEIFSESVSRDDGVGP